MRRTDDNDCAKSIARATRTECAESSERVSNFANATNALNMAQGWTGGPPYPTQCNNLRVWFYGN